jgi:acetylornithine deacetylase/succinyl-diaminopimelate desuccinylase-like protein
MSFDPLTKRLRTVSRIALYGSLGMVLVLAVVLLALAADPLRRGSGGGWGDVDFESLEEVRLLREYVQIDTSLATGSTLEGARFLQKLFEAEGLEVHLERVGRDDANLWVVLEGEQPGAVVLHHHMDVEDVTDPDAWPYPPFDGHIDLPWMYGQGVFDMKSIGIAQALAVIELARSGVRPERSLVFLATNGEETGSELGTQWMLREHPELTGRFDVVLTEGGVVEGRSRDDVKYWGTEFAQKRYWTLVACDPSRERLERLRQDIRSRERLAEPLSLGPEVREFLPRYAPTRDRQLLREALGDPERVLRDRPLFEGLPRYVKAMFRNELHTGRVRPVEGGGWELPVRIHLLPGVALEDVRDELLPRWLFFGVETRVDREDAADHGSPVDHWSLRTIGELLRETHGSVPAGPLFLPWTGTDSRFFRAHGIPSYGFSPFEVLTTDVLRVLGSGERISLPEYVDGVELYERLVRRLVLPSES